MSGICCGNFFASRKMDPENGIMFGCTYTPLILQNKQFLCSIPHHDTVKPIPAILDIPFTVVVDGKLYGLVSNDRVGPLVSWIAAISSHFHESRPI